MSNFGLFYGSEKNFFIDNGVKWMVSNHAPSIFISCPDLLEYISE